MQSSDKRKFFIVIYLFLFGFLQSEVLCLNLGAAPWILSLVLVGHGFINDCSQSNSEQLNIPVCVSGGLKHR